MPAKKKSKLINPKGESLTVEKFRELTGLQLSDEQTEEAVESIRKFARILFEDAIQQKRLTENKDESDL
jgi:hypothetical protein